MTSVLIDQYLKEMIVISFKKLKEIIFPPLGNFTSLRLISVLNSEMWIMIVYSVDILRRYSPLVSDIYYVPKMLAVIMLST